MVIFKKKKIEYLLINTYLQNDFIVDFIKNCNLKKRKETYLLILFQNIYLLKKKRITISLELKREINLHFIFEGLDLYIKKSYFY